MKKIILLTLLTILLGSGCNYHSTPCYICKRHWWLGEGIWCEVSMTTMQHSCPSCKEQALEHNRKWFEENKEELIKMRVISE